MFVFDENKRYISYQYTIEKHDRKNVLLNRQEFNNVLKLIRMYNKKENNELKDILTTALIIYNSALEKTHPYYMFLIFWQILEIGTLSNETRKNLKKFVKSRVLTVTKKDEVGKIIIDEICDKRNCLVHADKVDIDDIDLIYIKSVCEAIISFLCHNINKFKTKSMLEKYYKIVNIDDKNLIESKKIIDFILHHR